MRPEDLYLTRRSLWACLARPLEPDLALLERLLPRAELVEASLPPREVDLLLLCVAGWTKTAGLPERAQRQTNPGAVLLSHWDDFLRPVERPTRLLPAMAMPRLVDRLLAADRGLKVGTLPLLGAADVVEA